MRRLSEIAVAASTIGLALSGCSECPSGSIPLAATTFICVNHDQNGKCSLVEKRETKRCVAEK